MAVTLDLDSHELLTDRESAILALMADGLSDLEIADRLVLSRNTIKWYARRIFDKLHVKRRTQAIAIAQSLDLIHAAALPLVSTGYQACSVSTTALIGRSQELADLKNMLASPPIRLISVLGPGGIGKTYLAQALAQWWEAERPEVPVYFVSLENLNATEYVLPTLVSAIGAAHNGTMDAHHQLIAALRAKSVLLILDGFEEMIDGVPLLNDILGASPAVKVLVTSRQRLNLKAETLFPLSGLSYPINGNNPELYEAVQLFIQVARRVCYTFAPVGDDWQIISQICRLVEGFPLAVEIAASWLDLLSLSEIAAEISRGADLKTGAHDVLVRHRSLDTVFESSWQLLTEGEKSAFTDLAVFRGDFDRAAAIQIAQTSLFTLGTLVDKSLVIRIGYDQYRMHALARQFAEHKLKQDPEKYIAVQYRHCCYYGDLMVEIERKDKTEPETSLACLRELHRISENMMVGWSRAVETPFVDQISRYVYSMGIYLLPARLYEFSEPMYAAAMRALELRSDQVPTVDRVRVLAHYAWNALAWSKVEAASEAIDKALGLAEQLDDSFAFHTSFLYTFAGWISYFSGDLATARLHLVRGIDLCRQSHFAAGIWFALNFLDEIEYSVGNYDQAEQCFGEIVEMAQRPRFLAGLFSHLAARGAAPTSDKAALQQKFRQDSEGVPDPLYLDCAFGTLLGVGMHYFCEGETRTSLEVLAISQHHPLCSPLMKNKMQRALDGIRKVMPRRDVDAILKAAAEGCLSNHLLVSDFELSLDLMDHLISMLDPDDSKSPS